MVGQLRELNWATRETIQMQIEGLFPSFSSAYSKCINQLIWLILRFMLKHWEQRQSKLICGGPKSIFNYYLLIRVYIYYTPATPRLWNYPHAYIQFPHRIKFKKTSLYIVAELSIIIIIIYCSIYALFMASVITQRTKMFICKLLLCLSFISLLAPLCFSSPSLSLLFVIFSPCFFLAVPSSFLPCLPSHFLPYPNC